MLTFDWDIGDTPSSVLENLVTIERIPGSIDTCWNINGLFPDERKFTVTGKMLSALPSFAAWICRHLDQKLGCLYRAMRTLPPNVKQVRTAWPDLDFMLESNLLKHDFDISRKDNIGVIVTKYLRAHGISAIDIQASKKEGCAPDLSRVRSPELTRYSTRDIAIAQAMKANGNPSLKQVYYSMIEAGVKKNIYFSEVIATGLERNQEFPSHVLLEAMHQIHMAEKEHYTFDYMAAVRNIIMLFQEHVSGFLSCHGLGINVARMESRFVSESIRPTPDAALERKEARLRTAITSEFSRLTGNLLWEMFLHDEKRLKAKPIIFDIAARVENALKTVSSIDAGLASIELTTGRSQRHHRVSDNEVDESQKNMIESSFVCISSAIRARYEAQDDEQTRAQLLEGAEKVLTKMEDVMEAEERSWRRRPS